MIPVAVTVNEITWGPSRSQTPILHPTSFELAAGTVLGVVGPNGAGKTTLLRLLYRYHRPSSGVIRIDSDDLWSLSARAAAQRVAAVLQEQPSDFALTVGEIVALGRTPHKRGFGGSSGAHDREVIHKSLAELNLNGLANRKLGTLSGGERQRVMVARALAQEPCLLILDEPTNHLDIRHQLEVLELIRKLPLTIVTSLHDLNLASGVCDQILLLKNGHPLGFGKPEQVLSETTVSNAFHVTAVRDRLVEGKTNHLTYHLH